MNPLERELQLAAKSLRTILQLIQAADEAGIADADAVDASVIEDVREACVVAEQLGWR